jgi:hypothetical protein
MSDQQPPAARGILIAGWVGILVIAYWAIGTVMGMW